jgi:hypothetical protein
MSTPATPPPPLVELVLDEHERLRSVRDASSLRLVEVELSFD